MRKYIISILLLSLLAVHVSAQVRVGLKGGFDVIDHAIRTDIFSVKNRLGFQVGGTVEALIPGAGFGGEVSILYGKKEYKVEDKLNDTSISDYEFVTIPVNLKQRVQLLPGLGIFLVAGAYGEVKINGGNLEDVFNEYKSRNFTLGLNAGGGVQLFQHLDIGLYFRSDLNTKFTDKKVDLNVLQNKKFQTWNVGLSYYF